MVWNKDNKIVQNNLCNIGAITMLCLLDSNCWNCIERKNLKLVTRTGENFLPSFCVRNTKGAHKSIEGGSLTLRFQARFSKPTYLPRWVAGVNEIVILNFDIKNNNWNNSEGCEIVGAEIMTPQWVKISRDCANGAFRIRVRMRNAGHFQKLKNVLKNERFSHGFQCRHFNSKSYQNIDFYAWYFNFLKCPILHNVELGTFKNWKSWIPECGTFPKIEKTY